MARCKRCGVDMPNGAGYCPQCGRRVKHSGCLAAALITFGLVVLTVALMSALSKRGDTANANSELITLSEFNSIEMGMSYESVVRIIGSSGDVMSESDLGEGETYKMQLITWKGNGGIGSNANVTFQGGETVAKAQIGLK